MRRLSCFSVLAPSSSLGLDYTHHTLSVIVWTSRNKLKRSCVLKCTPCIYQKNNEAHRLYLRSGPHTLSSHCTFVLLFLLFSLTLRYCRLPDTHPFHFLSCSSFSGHLVPLGYSAYTLNFSLPRPKPLEDIQVIVTEDNDFVSLPRRFQVCNLNFMKHLENIEL